MTLTDYQRHILWLINNRLCMSMFDDRHPAVSAFLECGLVEKRESGLTLTGKGRVSLGQQLSVED
jgi:hypothetical protein